ncbi:hypothetical protein D3C72_1028730 [compost metagenome]
MQAAGRRVDHHVDGFVLGQPVERIEPAAPQLHAVLVGGFDKLFQHVARARRGAVGHHDARRPAFDQRQHRAHGGAAGAQQQHALALDQRVEVVLDIAHQAHAVGVVAVDQAVLDPQRVDRAGGFGTLGQAVGQVIGLQLERHRHVAAVAALGKELAHGIGKPVQRRLQAVVLHGFAGLARKGGVDRRRTAVRNRVADHHIAVGSGLGRISGCHQRACKRVSSPLRENLKVEMTSRMSWRDAISAVKGPNGAAARTIATAWRSSAGSPELLTTSMASML